jgi:DNA-binding CsgD family transcriptional regulator
VARKSAGTLEQQRQKIKRNYKRGSRTEKIVRGEASLSETEKYVAQEIALHLKAADFSWTYIGESLGISPNTVKSWFNSDDERGEELRAKLVQVSTDFVAGGIKLMKTYFIELVEMLAGIARETDDEKIVLEIFREFADRIGAVKVNKSESAALNLNRNEEHVEIDITDKTGLVAKLAKASA